MNTDAATLAARALGAIRSDVKACRVPSGVRSFSRLHDFVDANQYLEDAFEQGGLDLANDVANRVDGALAMSLHEPVFSQQVCDEHFPAWALIAMLFGAESALDSSCECNK